MPHWTRPASNRPTTVGTSIFGEYGTNIAGVFASEEVRTVETATPLAELLGIETSSIPQLEGLNEIPAGLFEGQSTTSLEGLLYLLGPVAWTFGLPLVPDVGDPSVNGITFDEGFDAALQTIYEGTASSTGTVNDVAFSSAGAIAVWALMNVNNPDFSILLNELINNQEFLPNTGQVIIEGSPGDWTLVSYDGVAVPQDPGLDRTCSSISATSSKRRSSPHTTSTRLCSPVTPQPSTPRSRPASPKSMRHSVNSRSRCSTTSSPHSAEASDAPLLHGRIALGGNAFHWPGTRLGR